MSETMEKTAEITATTTDTVDYLLTKLADLQGQLTNTIHAPCTVSQSIAEAFEALAETENHANCDTLANNITRAFIEREETYRNMIRLYEKMYDDLSAKQSLLREAEDVAKLIMRLEKAGEISELVFDSVVSPLVDEFQIKVMNVHHSN